MRIFLSPEKTLSIESPIVSLLDARPVLNGANSLSWQVEVRQEAKDKLLIHYRLSETWGILGVQARLDPGKERCTIRYWVEGLPEELPLYSFGLSFRSVENLRAYLRNGYFSWDGSFYVQPESLNVLEPYEERPETGYAMTQLLPQHGSGSLVAGFDRHDRFQQTFTFDTNRHPPALSVLTLWDQKDRKNLSQCEGENLVVFEYPEIEVEAALGHWAQLVADVSPTPPRTSGPPITGWCSWYNLYAYVNEENILEHLLAARDVARRENLPMRVFQIDDGFTPEMGDWLEVKPQFPRGIKPLLEEIRASGFIPGLWIAPFMVGNRSHLFRDHPDWVVKDRLTGSPLVQWKLYAEFRWHKRSEEYYILDATHPEAFEYLRQVFRTWRREWGCEYFKTDFMHFGSEHGPEKASWHIPGFTRIEIWRQVAEMIREEIGDAIWLGCGCPLWVTVGLVDGIRIGRDVGVSWSGNLSAQSLLRDQATRNFANHILWQIDPDCVLLRNRFHDLSDAEVRSLAIYAGMSGGVMMTSDALDQLSPDRIQLWKLILPEGRKGCKFPFLGQTALFYARAAGGGRAGHEARPDDPVLVQVRSLGFPSNGEATEDIPGKGCSAIFIFNTGEKPVQRTYTLASLGLHSPQYVYDWTADMSWPRSLDRISLTLPPHDGTLLFVGTKPILTAPMRLP